ncbi:tripartite tricarboxylate transporter TctB family protein [Bacillus sp. DTU_2020_1000418_1_SI_GHA_SEK_038]|uniref:tripartite tricarboxylate transporter TctB family protein n=1 Tax=Bacillus sp. DTU_2020_1000418_1_SI_GHA_SEK_038 TaxID=3077585 RepID=UPI0028E92738|nr:tripartite tricarboxylate transporter TctB family protein [Bacillus sp. DTU_2020_1000418_1_SI_GHA_SEK_038]WNS75358.1 tripartite tricarboxylate transporter TctB family protein [Bacillus sp. DTU_2020_1000418_1_SI_GHA_SEK_038]
MGEVIFHVVLIVIMGLFGKESFAISTGRSADPIGPAGFPQVLIGIILILLLISLFNSIRKMKAGEGKEALNINVAYFGLIIGIVVFIVLNDFISFTLASIAFCFLLFYLLGQKKYLKMSINSIIIAGAFTLIFGKVLSVPLPRGIGFIKELSYFLY